MIPLYIDAAITAVNLINNIIQVLGEHKLEMTSEQEAEFRKSLAAMRTNFNNIAPFVKKN